MMIETQLVSRSNNTVTLQVTLDLNGATFLDVENVILDACNAVGRKATEEALARYDTDGSAIMVEGKKLTARTKNRAHRRSTGKLPSKNALNKKRSALNSVMLTRHLSVSLMARMTIGRC